MGTELATADDRAAQDALIVEHLDLVQHIVNQVAGRYPRHVDRQELWNAGACGLVEAARRYRPQTGVPFARFASVRIRGAIIDSARDRDWVARSIRRRVREMREVEERFESAHGRPAHDDELASTLQISVDDLRARRTAAANAALLYLDHRYEDEDSLSDSVEETDHAFLPEDALCDRELNGTLRTALSHLPDVQREVIERYYLAGDMLRDIAESLGVTAARVSQICTEAINAIRAYLATLDEDVPVIADTAPGKRSRAAYVALLKTHSSWRSRLDAADAGWVLSSAG